MEFSSPLYPPVVLLLSGVIGLIISRLLRISPIVAFFGLGMLIGSYGLNLVDSHMPGLHFLAELGVCFLLFDVGLHLSIKELREGWREFLVVGILQFLLVTLFVGATAYLFGVPLQSALILGAIFSLSSTALVLKILVDHHEQSSPGGKEATNVLVFQDLAAIILLVLLTGAGSGEFSINSILWPLGKMLLAAFILVTVGRHLIKPLFRTLVAVKNDEVFTAFALLIVLFTSWVTQSLGLSLALGAFLGGLALSESSYAYIVRTEMAPFRGLLLSLFFISVGMSFDFAIVNAYGLQLILFIAAFFAVKTAANFVAFVLAGAPKACATRLSFLLSQGSEFAFVLLAAARASGLVSSNLVDLAIAVVGFSLVLTPVLANAGCALSQSVCSLSEEEDASIDDSAEVVVVELDDFGRQVAGVLVEEGIPNRGHDRDIERLTYAKSRGFNVYYSDPNRPRTLGRAIIGKVRAVVCCIEDDEIVRQLVTNLQRSAPNVPIFAATTRPERLELLLELGVEDSFLKSEFSLPLLIEKLLFAINHPADRISEALRRLQPKDGEEMFPRATGDILESEPIAA